MVGLASQLSVAVAAKLTGTNRSTAQPIATLAGQTMLGASVSLTVTVKEQELELSEESVAVHVTVVTPLEKVEPEAGVQTRSALPLLSVAVTE